MAKQKLTKFNTKLDAIDWRILDITFENPTLSQQEIGGKVGLTRQAVSYRQRNPLYQEELKAISRNALEAWSNLKVKAVRKYNKLLEAKKPVGADLELFDDNMAQLGAARDILSQEIKSVEQASPVTIIVDIPGLKMNQ